MIAPPTPVPIVTKTISDRMINMGMKELKTSKTFQVRFGEASRNIQKPKKSNGAGSVSCKQSLSQLAVSLSSQHASCQPQLLSKPHNSYKTGADKLEREEKNKQETVVEHN